MLEISGIGNMGSSIIFQSPEMKRIVSLMKKMAAIDCPVLILGESGVGKDVLATYVHYASNRSQTGQFVKVNCAAIPEQLMESEFFGYESGAFSGASKQGKAGLLELAHKGTIFLDEIGELPLSLQVKLLTVLQDMEVRRLGGTKSIPLDVRVIAATNADLDKMVREGKFRKDLLFRINVMSFYVPPLRDRTEDIFALILHFLHECNAKYGIQKTFSKGVIDTLLSCELPGNVRELRNMVERLAVLSDHDVIDESDLSLVCSQSRSKQMEASIEVKSVQNDKAGLSLKELMNSQEKEILAAHLRDYRPMKKCAEVLGIDLATLVRKKKKHGL